MSQTDLEKTPLLIPYASPGGYYPSAEDLEQERIRRRAQRRKRIFGHVIAFFVLFLGVKLILHYGTYHLAYHPYWSGMQDSEWPIPPEMTLQECADWPPEGEYSHLDQVQHSFELPLSSELLFLVARGPLTLGDVSIAQSDDESDSVVVSVSTHREDAHLLNSVKFCRVTADTGENGVGLFSLHPHRRHRRGIFFDIQVMLPKGSGDSPLLISNFQTKMDGVFGHRISDLSNSVFFDRISLSSAVRPIQVTSLNAGSAVMETVGSPIEGNFTVNESLKLYTANAHIDVSVNLLNKIDTTDLKMETVNAPIRASLSLFSEKNDDSSNGTFSIKAHNARGPVNITFPTAPINSTVDLKADTALAPVNINMHNTFEGSFVVHSTPFDKTVVVAEESEDPEGKDRKRSLIFDNINGGTTKGHVFWGEEGKDRGSIRLETSLGHISLKL